MIKFTGHGQLICRECKKVIISCRCMDCDKNIQYDICDECKKTERPPERPKARVVKEGTGRVVKEEAFPSAL